MKSKALIYYIISLLISNIYTKTTLKSITKSSIYNFETKLGKTNGFFIKNSSYYITDYKILNGLTKGKVNYTKNVKLNAYIEKDLNKNAIFKGYAIVKVNTKSVKYKADKLGDSDSVDINDKIYIPKLGHGEIIAIKQNFGNYYYPCFITNIKTSKLDSGKPVYDINNNIIGIFLIYNKSKIIVPINSIKKILKDILKKKYKEINSKEKIKTTNNIEKKQNIKTIIANKIYDLGNSFYNFGSIKDLTFDKNNNLYIVDNILGKIKKINFKYLNSKKKNNSLSKNSIENKKTKKVNIKKEKEELNNYQINKNKIKNLIYSKKVKTIKANFNKEFNNILTNKTKKIPSKKNKIKINNTNKNIKQKNIKKLSPSIKFKSKSPISISINSHNLIFVIDNIKKQIIVLNTNLKKISTINYIEIGKKFKPKKIRAIKNRLFIISKENNLYELEYNKSKSNFIASKINLSSKRWINIKIEDLSYNENCIYLLNKENKQILKITKNKKLNLIKLKAKIPSKVLFYNSFMYVFDKASRQIEVYDKNGLFSHLWNAKIKSNYGSPEDFTISPSGIFAISYRDYSHIRLFNMYGDLVYVIASFYNNNIYMDSPISISADNNFLRVLNGGQYINQINIENKFVLQSNVNLFNRNFRSIIHNKKYIFLGDLFKNQIVKCVDLDSCKYFGNLGSSFGEFHSAVQMDKYNDNIYIIDKQNNRIVKMDQFGKIIDYLILRNPSGKLFYSQDITIDKNGLIYVLAENMVLIYDSNFKFIKLFYIKKDIRDFVGFENFAKGITILDGLIYISDTYNHRILVYSSEGEYINSMGSRGDEINQLLYPWDVITYNSSIYVVDRGNHRIVEYSYLDKSGNDT